MQPARSDADHRDCVAPRDIRKALKKLAEGVSGFEIIKERLNGDVSADEARLAVHAPGIDRDIGRERAVGWDQFPLLSGCWRSGWGVAGEWRVDMAALL